jgi:myosin-5
VNVFKVTAAILHSSNLTFIDIPGTNGEECQLDTNNIQLDPVCLLFGVSVEGLNKALYTYTIQAGKSTAITRSVNKTKEASGLEALLEETYGALFNYFVRRVNGSIAYKDNRRDGIDGKTCVRVFDSIQHQNELFSPSQPAVSVGVLDIFGFESFTKYSFEQLCISYCNAALQQQCNAFVLRNEQAEYESEGIDSGALSNSLKIKMLLTSSTITLVFYVYSMISAEHQVLLIDHSQ